MKKLFKPALLLAVVAIMVIGMLGSGAWFSDTATSQAGKITSGTLSINDGKLSTVTFDPIVNMAPGDKTGEMVVVIENNGNVPLYWVGSLEATGDDVLKEAIYIDYALMQFEGGTWAEADDNFVLNGRGAGLYPGYYNDVADTSKFDLLTLDVFDASNPMGVAPYEFMGALKPGYAYRLTLRFGMAEAADNWYAGRGPLNIRFSAYATQPKAGAIHAINAGWDANYLEGWAAGQIANQTP